MRDLLLIFGLAAAYAVTGTLGLQLAADPGNVTSVWLPAGIALAALVVAGERVWPGITLGAFVTNLLIAPAGATRESVLGALTIAAGSTFGIRLTRWLIARMAGEHAVASPGRVTAMTLAIAVGCAVSAAVGTLTTLATAPLTSSAAPGFWFTWWLGDSVGMLLIVPFVLSEGVPAPRRLLELGCSLVAMMAVVQAVFGVPIPGLGGTTLPLAWAVVPSVVWAGVRLGVRGVVVHAMMLFALLTSTIVTHTGPFSAFSRETALVLNNGLLSAVVMMGLLLAAALAQVRAQQALLSARVRERTAELESANRALVLESEERGRLSSRLIEAQKQEALGRLAGGVAHDFNNLLTVITGEAELIALDKQVRPELHDGAEAILAATHRATELTRQLLAVARRQPSRPINVDVAEQLQQARRLLRPLFPESIELEVAAAPRCTVRIDPLQLDQIVLNLALNARDACGAHGAVRILSALRTIEAPEAKQLGLTAGAWVVVTLTDTGSGIAPEVLPRIFEPFFTTKTAERGTGLGLSTVMGIATQCGGTVRVSSKLGEGSTFEVWLPASAEVAAPLAPARREAQQPKSSASLLVVEDEPLVRRTVVLTLEGAGFEVTTASDGEEALAVLKQRSNFDLVLTDVVMPRMGGLEFAKKLRLQQPNVPVLFMSGFHEHQAELGGEEVLSKPFAPSVLLARVNQALRAAA